MKKISFGKISLGGPITENSSEGSNVVSGFGKIDTTKPEPEVITTRNEAPVSKGPQKHARLFNVDEMMAEITNKVSENQKELLIADPEENVMEAMGFAGFGKVKAPPKKAKAPPPSVPKINKTKAKPKADQEEKTDPEKPIIEELTEAKDGEASSSDEEATIEKSDILPISHEITLNHAIKAVSGLALDPAGSRLVTGSQDFDVKFWDFNAMDARFQSFRTIQPMENYHITSIEYSITGDQILFCSGGPQPQVLDRDGSQVYECRKGDQYIVDMTNTYGHVSACYNAVWHPKDRHLFMSSSSDCTVRVWDINVTKNQKTVIKLKGQDRRKISPSHAVYSRDGSLICVATVDGAISCYNSRGPYVRPKLTSKSAHTMGTETSCLKFAADGHRLLSRGGDDTMKLWDLRKFTQPVHVADNLDNVFIGTDCWFSPDEKIVMTGTSVKQGSGELVFYDASTFEEFYRFSVGESSVSKILWHPKLNQIVVGCSNGKVKIYYSPTQSFNGAKLCTAKARRRKAKNDEIPTGLSEKIITPYSLPMFRENKFLFAKRRKDKARKDPQKSAAPDKPEYGLDAHKTKGCSAPAYMSKKIALEHHEAPAEEEDPRVALLKYDEECKKNPYWIAPAYGTATETQYEEVTEQTLDEEPAPKKPMYFYHKG